MYGAASHCRFHQPQRLIIQTIDLASKTPIADASELTDDQRIFARVIAMQFASLNIALAARCHSGDTVTST
ncbi:hypothetical protein WM40_05790 [Robbsia andropogonis]|uniref:Uncharacterized protein n=1 Tax=Robbsia andropogonis TaxID=28092 RepID=A0A0F5K4G2_9BURK|nr:hypothetical protein WM40_05790 [Robbsia andropogonis]